MDWIQPNFRIIQEDICHRHQYQGFLLYELMVEPQDLQEIQTAVTTL